jgi:hypothetical protein
MLFIDTYKLLLFPQTQTFAASSDAFAALGYGRAAEGSLLIVVLTANDKIRIDIDK